MTAPAQVGPSPTSGGPAHPLNDGYGDQPTIDETIASYEAWLHHRVHQMLAPTDPRHDDLVQEGRIAMWQAHDRHDPAKGALPSWLTQHAQWHMQEVLARRGKWTGSPDRRDGRHAVQEPPTTSLDALVCPDDDRPADESAGGVAEDIADKALDVYHRDEIAEALAGLTEAQRRYVLLRFWRDAPGAELKEAFGYDPRGLWKTSRGGAQQRLAKSLAHLADAA